MKTINIFLALALAITTSGVSAKELIIDKQTKKITPTRTIYAFELIDWEDLENRQDSGKSEITEVQVMMCDDTYFSLVEIEFEGLVGKDVRVETDCNLEGALLNDWVKTSTLQFDGPESNSCTITIEKKQNNKKIRMNYELHDAC